MSYYISTFVPAAPAGVTFTDVKIGTDFSIALGSNCKAYTTGCNTIGQLGDGTTVTKCCWVPVCCNYTYSRISATVQGKHVLAIKTDGCAVAWGCNNSAQLGDGTCTAKCQPVAVCCNCLYCEISAGARHSVGVKTNGCAVSWGANISGIGNLGNGLDNGVCCAIPVAVCCNYLYCLICASTDFTVGIKTNGCAVSWGANDYGGLGNGGTTITPKCQPVAVCCNYLYCKISAGICFTVGIKTNGCAVSWGTNTVGQLGTNNSGTGTCKCQPVAVCCNCLYCEISTGNTAVVGIKTNGCAVSWGAGTCGQLGCGTSSNIAIPVAVCCNYLYCKISLGGYQAVLAIKTDGCAVAWGNGTNGILGIGATTACISQPVASCGLT